MGEGGGHGGSVWQTNVPMQPLWVLEMGRAVMSRELAKDEEVTLLGSQLCQGLWDLFFFTTLNLISSTISPFHFPLLFFFSCSSVSYRVRGPCSRLAFHSLPILMQPFWDFFFYPSIFSLSSSSSSSSRSKFSFHLNRHNSISFLLTPPHCSYLLFKPSAVPPYVLPPVYRCWPTSVSTCNCALD